MRVRVWGPLESPSTPFVGGHATAAVVALGEKPGRLDDLAEVGAGSEPPMAGRGPAAHHPDEVRRRNKKATAETFVDDGKVHGPDLPESYRDGTYDNGRARKLKYTSASRRFWDAFRRAPEASGYSAHHWLYLRDQVMPLYDAAARGSVDAKKELRLQQRPFGLTPADRNSLGWKVDTKVVPPAAAQHDDESSSRRQRRSVAGQDPRRLQLVKDGDEAAS